MTQGNLGYVWIDGEWWNGMGWDKTMFHCLVLQERNGMECDGTHSIQYHPFSQIFIPPNLGCIQWNGIHK